jgi:ribonuclease P protein component
VTRLDDQGTGSTGEHLPRARRLLKRLEFERIYKTGERRHGQLMTLFMASASGACTRVGVAATRKLGSAVTRNRAKRLAREVFRRHQPPGGIDVVIVPKLGMVDADFSRIEAEFVALLRKGRPSDRGPGSTPNARRTQPARPAQGL